MSSRYSSDIILVVPRGIRISKKGEDSKSVHFFSNLSSSVCRTRPPLVLIILDNTKLIFIKIIYMPIYTHLTLNIYLYFLLSFDLDLKSCCHVFHFPVFFCILNIIHFKMMGCFVSVGYKSDNFSNKAIKHLKPNILS